MNFISHIFKIFNSKKKRNKLCTADIEIKQLSKQIEKISLDIELSRKLQNRQILIANALMRQSFCSDFFAPDSSCDLTSKRFQLYSQNEEDGITLECLRRVGVLGKSFVEIGCGGSGGNSALLAAEFGWRGLMADVSENAIKVAKMRFSHNPYVEYRHEKVTPNNINEIIRNAGFSGEIDFCSIDIDSFDYWVFEALEIVAPRVLILEYNAIMGFDHRWTISRDSDLSNAPKGVHGASLSALSSLADRKGYILVGCEPSGTNAFFVRKEFKGEFREMTPREAFKPSSANARRKKPIQSAEHLMSLANDSGINIVSV